MSKKLACPFGPHCTAELAPVGQRAAVGSERIVYVYPLHRIEGPESSLGQCPASQVMIIGWPERAGLSFIAETMLGQARSTWAKMGVTAPAATGPIPKTETTPGAAPRPTIGSPVDNMREQLKQMTAMTIESIERSLLHLAATIESIDQVQSMLIICGTQADATIALGHAAVGTSENMPVSAHRMIAELINAFAIADSTGGELLPALGVLREVVSRLAQTYEVAREAGVAYMRTL